MEQTKVVLARSQKPRSPILSSRGRSSWACLSIFAVLLLLVLTACSSLERSPNSGYSYRFDDRHLPTSTDDRKRWERAGAMAELGPLANDQAVALRQAVRREEKRIESKQDKEVYYKARPFLKSDSERLQFLRLESERDRERYLAVRGVASDSVTHPPEIQDLIEQNDISYGMTKQAVRDSWGPPESVEVAGDPMYGNEKWYYTEQVTSSEGYTTERRVVTFEGGVVVGWQTR